MRGKYRNNFGKLMSWGRKIVKWLNSNYLEVLTIKYLNTKEAIEMQKCFFRKWVYRYICFLRAGYRRLFVPILQNKLWIIFQSTVYLILYIGSKNKLPSYRWEEVSKKKNHHPIGTYFAKMYLKFSWTRFTMGIH